MITYFRSFKEAFNYVRRGGTHFEKENGLKTEHIEVIHDTPSMKICLARSTDKQNSLVIIYQTSKKYDIWKFWTPTEEQIIAMKYIYKFYKNINRKNTKIWKNLIYEDEKPDASLGDYIG